MKKSICLFLTLLAVIANTFLMVSAQSLPDEHAIIVVSHRGDWRNAPENSLQAIQNCVDMGVDMVEIDLKRTKDGQLILLHDNLINRTMTGTGKPSDYTLEELKAMRLKNGAGSATRHQVPTLEEAMQLAKDKIKVNIDKGYDYFKEVIPILENTGTIGQVIIKSGLPYQTVIKENQELLDKVAYMPVVNANAKDAVQFVSDYLSDDRIKSFEVNFQEMTPQVQTILETLKRSGKEIWINTLWPHLCDGMDDDRAVELGDIKHSWQKVIDLGVRYIQTDRPAELINYLNETKQR
jgi:glycerophosphoryl diester phosphodiesterase